MYNVRISKRKESVRVSTFFKLSQMSPNKKCCHLVDNILKTKRNYVDFFSRWCTR